MSLLTSVFIENDMKRMWSELSESDRSENLKVSKGWLKYALKYQRVDDWPYSMVNVCLRNGPYRKMKPRDAVKMLFFFYGKK